MNTDFWLLQLPVFAVEISGRDPLIRSKVVFYCDYGLVLNQNLVQFVQGLSLPYALKIAGPYFFFFIDLVRPKVELNRDSCIFFGGSWPFEIFGHKIIIFLYAILPS